jgi:hypothetical protein
VICGQGIIKVAKAVGVGNGTVQRIKEEMARGSLRRETARERWAGK